MQTRSLTRLLERRLLRQRGAGIFEHFFARETLECGATAAQSGEVQRGEEVPDLEATIFNGWRMQARTHAFVC